ncbi:MAG: 4'-phosphopantetheinyl transferase family protein [Acidimicrobiales bacterium]
MIVEVHRRPLRPPAAAEWDLLDPLEVERAAGFRFDDDRRRFVLAAALVRDVVAERLALPVEAIGLDRSCDDCGRPHGRPVVVTDADEPPHVSISHAGGWVVVAVADAPVGVDVEETSRWSDAVAQLVDQVAAPGETIPIDDGGSAFFSAWTRKEAVLKATGDGLRVAMREVRIGATESEVGGRRYPSRVEAFEVGPGHVGAVAVLDDQPLEVRLLER